MEIIISSKNFDNELYHQGKSLDKPLMEFEINTTHVEEKFNYSD